MTRILITTALAALLAAPVAGTASADEISDTLQSALDAYNEGDLSYALEELEYAKQKMIAAKADNLTEYLPAAPDGWSREVNTDMNAGLAMMGGGVGAEAAYSGPDGDVTLTIMADNPMVGAMSGMLANAAMMGMKVERVGRQKFAIQDNTVQGLVDNRILVKGEGDPATVLGLLETMDFRALGDFGN